MQRGARFAIFDVPFGAPCWAQGGRPKRYKNNVFLLVLKMTGGHQMDPEEQKMQNI